MVDHAAPIAPYLGTRKKHDARLTIAAATSMLDDCRVFLKYIRLVFHTCASPQKKKPVSIQGVNSNDDKKGFPTI